MEDKRNEYMHNSGSGAEANQARTKKYYADCETPVRVMTILEQLECKRSLLINSLQEIDTMISFIKNDNIPDENLKRFQKMFAAL